MSILAFLCLSCTDLDSNLYSELTPNNFFKNDNQFVAALGTAYTPLYAYAGDPWTIQELSSETSVAPAKFGPWDDGGVWAALHRHQFSPNFGSFNASWNMGFGGISTCNRLIEQLTALAPPDKSPAFVAELRALRAFYYFMMIDMFGDAPLITSFSTAETNPARKPRAEVFIFVVKELNEVIPKLPDGVNSTTYGRMNKWSALTLLTKLYLNAGVYAKKTEWVLAASTAKQVIDGAKYSLEGNYFNNFIAKNDASRENIFIIPYESGNAGGFNLHMRTLHPLNKETYNFSSGPWNGYTALEEFYNSYSSQDIRKKQFIVGQQFTADGKPINDPNGATEVDSKGAKDPDGAPLIFTPFINELTPKAFSQSGARLGKFEFQKGIQLDMNNDFPLFRYADVLLMRAEALWRSDNASAEAATLVNQIRSRASSTSLTSLNEDNLYQEIMREMAYEGHSRTNAIRFGRFTKPRWEKPESTINKMVFPVPTNQLNGNPNFKQNAGY